MAIVLDLYSRRVVGWSMSASMGAQLVLDALFMALWRRGKPKQLMHPSDLGSQYTSEDFQRLLAADGIVVQHELPRGLLGQCRDGKLLLVVEPGRTSRR